MVDLRTSIRVMSWSAIRWLHRCIICNLLWNMVNGKCSTTKWNKHVQQVFVLNSTTLKHFLFTLKNNIVIPSNFNYCAFTMAIHIYNYYWFEVLKINTKTFGDVLHLFYWNSQLVYYLKYTVLQLFRTSKCEAHPVIVGTRKQN